MLPFSGRRLLFASFLPPVAPRFAAATGSSAVRVPSSYQVVSGLSALVTVIDRDEVIGRQTRGTRGRSAVRKSCESRIGIEARRRIRGLGGKAGRRRCHFVCISICVGEQVLQSIHNKHPHYPPIHPIPPFRQPISRRYFVRSLCIGSGALLLHMRHQRTGLQCVL